MEMRERRKRVKRGKRRHEDYNEIESGKGLYQLTIDTWNIGRTLGLKLESLAN